MIKTFAQDLKRLIDIRERLQRSELENELELLKVSGYDFSNVETSLFDIKEKIKKAEENLRIKLEKHYPMEETLSVCIQTKVTNDTKKNTSFIRFDSFNTQRPFMYINVPEKNAKNLCYQILNGNEWKERKYSVGDSKLQQYVSNIKIPIDCTEGAAFLLDFFENKGVNDGDCVAIWGDIVRKPNGILYATLDKGKSYPNFVFEFRKIKGIAILDIDANDNPILDGKKWKKIDDETEERKLNIKNHFESLVKDIAAANYEEEKGFLEEVFTSKKLKTKISNIVETNHYQQDWDSLRRKMQNIISSNLMKNVQNVRTKVATSNLFAYEVRYKRLYDAMLKDNGAVSCCSYEKSYSKEIKMAKLPDLYERWCLIKLLVVFVCNYGFKLNDQNDPSNGRNEIKQIIESILQDRDELNGCEFRLREPATETEITIFYDREFVLDSKKVEQLYIDRKLKKKISKLRPDFFLRIKCNNTEAFYAFDAKYRGNNQYDGIKDICEVAFQKYMFLLNEAIDWKKEFGIDKGKIEGSFIIHSSEKTVDFWKKEYKNNSNEIETEYNAGCYLGDSIDKWVPIWLERIRATQRFWEFSESELSKWCKWERKVNNNENRIGTFTCNTRINNFVYSIQMIMERKFNSYADRCWICGSKVYVENKETKSKFSKQHIKCNNPECGKFTVRTHCSEATCPSHSSVKKISLGKHYRNYYSQAIIGRKSMKWNVACPVCRGLADSN